MPRGTVHTGAPPPAARPGPGARADMDSLVRARRSLALSALAEGAGAHHPLQLTSQAGRGGRAGGACGRAPIPHRGLLGARSGGEQRARRSLLTRLEPEAQKDPPKCREMCGLWWGREGLARDVAPPAGRRRAPGTRRARASGVGGTRGAARVRDLDEGRSRELDTSGRNGAPHFPEGNRTP